MSVLVVSCAGRVSTVNEIEVTCAGRLEAGHLEVSCAGRVSVGGGELEVSCQGRVSTWTDEYARVFLRGGL